MNHPIVRSRTTRHALVGNAIAVAVILVPAVAQAQPRHGVSDDPDLGSSVRLPWTPRSSSSSPEVRY